MSPLHHFQVNGIPSGRFCVAILKSRSQIQKNLRTTAVLNQAWLSDGSKAKSWPNAILSSFYQILGKKFAHSFMQSN